MRVGDTVQHEKYGRGTIIDLGFSNERTYATCLSDDGVVTFGCEVCELTLLDIEPSPEFVNRMEGARGRMIHGQGVKERTEHGCVRESNEGRGRFDLLPYEALESLAKWYELGAEKYGDRNWEEGISVKDCINRLIRHALKAGNGWTDEDHLAACMWNAAAAITMIQRRPDCNDHRWVPEKTVAPDQEHSGRYDWKEPHPIRKNDVVLSEEDQFFLSQAMQLQAMDADATMEWFKRRRKDQCLKE